MDDAEQDMQSDSTYSVSKTAEGSSPAQNPPSSSGGKPRKRKIQEDSTMLHGRVKRMKILYNDGYRKLYNETVAEMASEETPKQADLPRSQIGATLWSPEEKQILFCSLARRGRHGIQDAAAALGSKSESEVYIYLEKLQEAATAEQICEPNKKLPKAFDIPTAFEVSQKCCASLDVAAQALSVLQQQEDERVEKKKHGSVSLLTPKIAQWAERRLTAGEGGNSEISETLPAAELLNLKAFLALSKRFFMNSSIMENNWRTYTERLKSPTILYTAFSDFHSLAMSITRRIVQASLFLAMSRRRALDASGNYSSGRHVKKADVLAALNVLGIEGDTKRVWAEVARKCKLRVFEKTKHRQTSGKRYSYNEIEAILSSVPSKARGRSRAASRDHVNPSLPHEVDIPDNVLLDSSDDSESSGSPSTMDEESDDVSDSALSINAIDHKQADKQELRDEALHSYAEAIDQRASRAEERRLWELLGEDSAERMGFEDVDLPTRPMAKRKAKEDLVDWKNWVNYTREWEVYEKPVPMASFTENRRLGRNVGTAAGLTDSETDSEIVVDDASSNPRSSHRSSSRSLPLSDESVGDESSSEEQSSRSKEEKFRVGPHDANAICKLKGIGDSMGDELDEPEEEPQHSSSGQKLSSNRGSSEREQIMVDKGHRNSRPPIRIAINPDVKDSGDSNDTDE